MRSSSEGINIAASAQRLDVDNRIALRYYYRIADNILKQVLPPLIYCKIFADYIELHNFRLLWL